MKSLDDYLGVENPSAETIAEIRQLCEDAIDASTPGRYEGEPLYTAWYDMIGQNGFADYGDCDCQPDDVEEDCDVEDWECSPDCGSNDWLFDVTTTDRLIFPELKEARIVRIHVTDTGFVCASIE